MSARSLPTGLRNATLEGGDKYDGTILPGVGAIRRTEQGARAFVVREEDAVQGACSILEVELHSAVPYMKDFARTTGVRNPVFTQNVH